MFLRCNFEKNVMLALCVYALEEYHNDTHKMLKSPQMALLFCQSVNIYKVLNLLQHFNFLRLNKAS